MGEDAAEPEEVRSADSSLERCIRCATCAAPVASLAAATQVNGQHVHRCRNPAGFDGDVRCFAETRCGVVGEPELAWTWFPPFAWQIALCPGCGRQLGWRYSAAGLTPFWGLIAVSVLEK